MRIPISLRDTGYACCILLIYFIYSDIAICLILGKKRNSISISGSNHCQEWISFLSATDILLKKYNTLLNVHFTGHLFNEFWPQLIVLSRNQFK
ncbi:MAG: hypothetical protein JWQ66_2864 [Mucilaginibacter sp.]|nr:hypothetical protein [Mucilaginibacter sp.]